MTGPLPLANLNEGFQPLASVGRGRGGPPNARCGFRTPFFLSPDAEKAASGHRELRRPGTAWNRLLLAGPAR
jgi:hypothetical protein